MQSPCSHAAVSLKIGIVAFELGLKAGPVSNWVSKYKEELIPSHSYMLRKLLTPEYEYKQWVSISSNIVIRHMHTVSKQKKSKVRQLGSLHAWQRPIASGGLSSHLASGCVRWKVESQACSMVWDVSQQFLLRKICSICTNDRSSCQGKCAPNLLCPVVTPLSGA